jgi:hypothetical protein
MSTQQIRHLSIKPAANGYIVAYDLHTKSKESYDGYSYAGEKTEVFTSGSKAIKRFDELKDMMPLVPEIENDDD